MIVDAGQKGASPSHRGTIGYRQSGGADRAKRAVIKRDGSRAK
jgi:hypothetical protein